MLSLLLLRFLLFSSANASFLSWLTSLFTGGNSDTLPGNVNVDAATIAEINRMKVYSAIAYCPGQITNFQCGPICGQDEVKGTNQSVEIESPSKQTSGFVAFNNQINSIIISFKGTSNAVNFIADIASFSVDSRFSKTSGLKVHFGFQESYLSIREGIMAQLRSLIAKHSSASIRVTGHSLGAAMASLCVLDMVQNLPDKLAVTSLYTFGQPRVGNEIFSSAVEAALPGRIFRTTHVHDLVTNLPTFSMFQGSWTHHSSEYWVSENNFFKLCNGREDPTCSLREDLRNANTIEALGNLLNPRTKKDLESHDLRKYSDSALLDCN